MLSGFGFKLSQHHSHNDGNVLKRPSSGGGGGGGSGYTANAVKFSTGQTLDTASLADTDSPYVAISYWVRYETDADRGNAYTFVSDPDNAWLTSAGCWSGGADDGKLGITIGDSTQNNVFLKWIADAATTSGQWHHVIMVLDGNQNVMAVYQDRQKVGHITQSPTTVVSHTIPFSPNFNGLRFCVGSDGYNDAANFEMADFYMALGHNFLEADGTLSGSTLDKFITSDLKPVSLGANGELPTGAAPTIFLHCDGTDPASFAVNHGTGGALALSSAISLSSSNPGS